MDKKNLQRIKRAEALEALYQKNMTDEYIRAYKEIKRSMVRYIADYTKDGKMGADMLKYDRFDKITKDIMSNIANIKSSNPSAVNTYLKDVYIDSYMYTGFTLETNWQAKTGIREISRSKIDPLNLMNKVTLSNNATAVRNSLQQAISIGINQGDGVGAISKRLKGVLEGNMNDTLRIARTETTTALNQANLDGMRKAVEVIPIQKQWVSTLDGRTRDRHRSMDGETVDVDKAFSNGLMMPGDPTGRPEQIINCRCAMREIVEGYSNSATYRRARGVDGKNEVIPYKTYDEWTKGL